MNNNIRNTSVKTDDAIQRVLQAERDAEQAIHECEQEAQQIITDARKRAQAINSRTDQRITNLEMRYGHQLDREIKTIEREGAVELKLDANQRVDPDSLRAAIKDLALELCQADD
jgi:vacuolar-type H+-ATPase subunit H